MIDYAELIATLERHADEQEAEAARTRDIIAAVRKQVNGGGGGRGKPKSPPTNGRRPKATGGRPKKAAATKGSGHAGVGHPKVTPEQWEQARKAWDAGENAEAIGKRFGISGAGVFYHANAHHWPKRASGRKKAAAPKGEKLSGSTRCGHCQVLTAFDPCQHCGKKLERKWT